jgi:uncharacterized protein YkwD
VDVPLSGSRERIERFSPAAALFVAVVSVAALLPGFGPAPGPFEVPASQEIPPLEALERRLFEAVNRERASRGIPALRENPKLVELARAQSEDMARLSLLAHLSATAETLTDRLRKAGVYFAANAENVARSDSFDPNLIHESLMNSPEHREAILNPVFDEAGMAIARGADGDYYATQDFIRSLTVRDEQKVRERILETVEEAARERGASPPSPIEDLHAAARDFARIKGTGRELPPIAPAYGAASARFLSGGDLDALLATVRTIETKDFRFVGAGSWFGRTSEFPGGAYVVCVFLIPGEQALDMSAAERRQAVLEALNGARAAIGRQPLELDEALCRQAEEFNRRFRQRGRPGPPRGTTRAAWFYKTPDLGKVPDGVRKAVSDRAVRRIGISVLPPGKDAGLDLDLSVAVILED